MRIGLIDVDGHNFSNLALMRISSYHKAHGDDVEWWVETGKYDIVYKSKVFSSEYSPDVPDPENTDLVIKGGTGYAISLINGKEVFDEAKHTDLAPEIEAMRPDYSIYPQYDFAVAMTSRGCPRNCPFCHVSQKEGCKSLKVANVSDFWDGQKVIQCCDPNILACKDREDLLDQYAGTKARIEFNQGLDIRLLTEPIAKQLAGMKLYKPHFAWDNPNDDLLDCFKTYAEVKGIKPTAHGTAGVVYCLTNFEDCSAKDHVERALTRIYALRDLGFAPYIMIYNKPNAARIIRRLARWCNNRILFYSNPDFYTFLKTYYKGEK